MHEVVPNSMIYAQPLALSKSYCKKVIAVFERDVNEQVAGKTLGGLRTHVKKTVDIRIDSNLKHWEKDWRAIDRAIFGAIHKTLRHYAKLHDIVGRFNMADSGYNLQRYAKGKGFYNWHSDGTAPGVITRQVSVILYLNDVARGGETEFKYFKTKVKPEAGKLLLFPSFWPHLHRSIKPESGDKYVIVSFMHLAGPEFEAHNRVRYAG